VDIPFFEIQKSMRKTMIKTKNYLGFTLLEVMVAMAFIAVTLVAVLDAQSGSLSRACEAKFNTTAALLAQEKISELETAKAEDLISDSGDFGDDFPDYYWKITIEEPSVEGPENISDHLKQIDLTVSWGEDTVYSYHLKLYRFTPTPR